MNFAGQTGLSVDLHYRHEIKAQQSEIREIVLRKALARKMRVYAPKSAKTVVRHACSAKIRHLDLLCGSDHHVLDLTLTI
mgnify:CR=1 FL=1